MRCMLGLDRPERGTTTFDGRRFDDAAPAAARDRRAARRRLRPPGRSGRNHLRWLAASNGLARRRVDEVLGAGRADRGRRAQGARLLARHAPAPRARRRAARRPAHGHPRRAGATASTPRASAGSATCSCTSPGRARTVLVSSHLLSEIALMADDLVVIGRGRLIEQGPVSQFIDRHADAVGAGAHAATRRRSPSSCGRPGRTYEPAGARRHRGPRPGDRAGRRAGGAARRRAARAVAAERVAGGRLPQGDGRATAGVPVRDGLRWRRVIDAIRSEWIKVSTITVTWVLAIDRRRLPARRDGPHGGVRRRTWSRRGPGRPRQPGSTIVTAMLLGVVATIAVTNEFGHGTIRPTFAAMPDRLRPLLAKPIVQVVDHGRADRRRRSSRRWLARCRPDRGDAPSLGDGDRAAGARRRRRCSPSA